MKMKIEETCETVDVEIGKWKRIRLERVGYRLYEWNGGWNGNGIGIGKWWPLGEMWNENVSVGDLGLV